MPSEDGMKSSRHAERLTLTKETLRTIVGGTHLIGQAHFIRAVHMVPAYHLSTSVPTDIGCPETDSCTIVERLE